MYGYYCVYFSATDGEIVEMAAFTTGWEPSTVRDVTRWQRHNER